MHDFDVVWSREAIYDVADIADYIELCFGRERADCFNDDIDNEVNNIHGKEYQENDRPRVNGTVQNIDERDDVYYRAENPRQRRAAQKHNSGNIKRITPPREVAKEERIETNQPRDNEVYNNANGAKSGLKLFFHKPFLLEYFTSISICGSTYLLTDNVKFGSISSKEVCCHAIQRLSKFQGRRVGVADPTRRQRVAGERRRDLPAGGDRGAILSPNRRERRLQHDRKGQTGDHGVG